MSGQDGVLSRALISHGLVREEQLRALAARRGRGDPRPLAEVLVAERLVSREQLARLLDPGPAATHAPTLDLSAPPLLATTPPSGPGHEAPGHDPGASSRRLQLERGVTISLGGDLRVSCERLLGQGGMGTVHLVTDLSLGRTAALKLVRGEGHPTRGKRFRREIVLTARLDHPGIPPVYQAGRTASGQDYLLMRFVDGEALDAVLDRVHQRARGASDVSREPPAGRAPEPRELLDALVKVAEAVAYAHSRGVVHRDLKPANLMLGAFGETFVMDWGLARDLSESRSEDDAVRVALAEGHAESRGLTQDGALLGTPGYMAPEQARGEDVDARADVFALGSLLTEVLTGEPALSGRTALEVLAKTGAADVVLPRARRPDVARELDAIAARCLALDPDERYSGAGEVAADLKAYLEGRPVSVHRYGLVDQTRRLVRRHPAPVAALGVASVLTIAGVVAVGRAREVAARAERSQTVQAARDAAAQAAGAVAALSSEVTLDRRVGAFLAALQAAQRWRTLAQDDPAAATAQRDAALGLGEVALRGEQWSLAAEAFTHALGLGDDAAARDAIARVERARNAEAERRRAEVEAVLAEAASGALGRVPDGREDAVLRLARIEDAATVGRLVTALDDVSARLEEALRAAWLEGGVATRDERQAGDLDVEGLAEAADAVLRAGLEGKVGNGLTQRVALAEGRLARRAARARGGGGRSALQLLAARQAAAVGQSSLDVARVAADALGRMRRRDALPSLARHLAAERDPARALPAAMALCRLGGPRALALVLQARERFGRHTGFGARLDPLLAVLEGDAPLEADTGLGHLRRGEAYEARGRLAEAEADYDRAIQLDPRLAWAFCRRGTVRYQKGRVAEALADYDQAIALDPSDARYWGNRANARDATGDVTGALQDYERALTLDPALAAARMNRGLLRQRSGDRPGAHHDFDEALATDPLLISGWVNRGLLLLSEGDRTGASADLERALALDPRHPNALLGRAMLRRGQGDLDGALADLEVVRAVAPDLRPAQIVRGQVKADRGDLDGAVAELDAAVDQPATDPSAVDALRERAEVRRRRGELPRALEDLNRALVMQPGSVQLLVLRGDIRREADDARGALADGERVIQLAPGDERGWLVRGEARSTLGDHEGAAADMDKAVALEPRSARARYGRALVRRRAGAGPRECLPDLDAALELDPDLVLARSDRGVARLNLGLDGPAAEDFVRCTQLAPGVARYWSNLGNALGNLGNEGAIAALDRAIALDPRLAEAFVNRGIAHVKQQDPRSARRDFERAIELDPRLARAFEGRALTRRDLRDAGWPEDARRAVTLDPTMAISWCLLAEQAIERRDYRAALDLLDKPLALPEHPARARLMRAMCREKLGDVPGAITDVEAFLAAAPSSPEAVSARKVLERLKAGR